MPPLLLVLWAIDVISWRTVWGPIFRRTWSFHQAKTLKSMEKRVHRCCLNVCNSKFPNLCAVKLGKHFIDSGLSGPFAFDIIFIVMLLCLLQDVDLKSVKQRQGFRCQGCAWESGKTKNHGTVKANGRKQGMKRNGDVLVLFSIHLFLYIGVVFQRYFVFY